jgi:FMN phosphatase YigB (HAD superfamily)
LELDEEGALRRMTELRADGVGWPFDALATEAGLPPEAAGRAERAFFVYPDLVPPLELDARAARALDLMAELAPLALLTTGDEATQRRKVERLGIAARFEELVFAPFRGGGKTTMLGELIERRGWRGERAVVVGDRARSDVRAGNAHGCLTVLVRRAGNEFAAETPRDACETPDHVCPDLLAAAELLQRA